MSDSFGLEGASDTFSAWEARAGEMFLHPEITAHRICRLYEWICFRYHLGQEQRYIQSWHYSSKPGSQQFSTHYDANIPSWERELWIPSLFLDSCPEVDQEATLSSSPLWSFLKALPIPTATYHESFIFNRLCKSGILDQWRSIIATI